MVVAQGVVALGGGDEVGGNQPRSLMQKLEKGVLANGPRLAENDRRGGAIHRLAAAGDALAVAFHFHLLQISGQQLQALIVRNHGVAFGGEEIDIPDTEEAENYRQVLGQRRGAEVLVHGVGA